jgi:hypothetical protein
MRSKHPSLLYPYPVVVEITPITSTTAHGGAP